MNQTKLIIFISIFLFIGSSGCKKDELHEEWFNAEILGKGIDCGDTYLISFIQTDKEEILEILEIEEDGLFPTYYALNLPNEYKIEGLKVRVKFGRPTPNVDIPCTTLGPGYHHIWISQIEKVNNRLLTCRHK